jgi:hypothetical protein
MTESGRSCTRCRKELTDAASQEAGIGPICRDLDNAVLARLIPSNVAKARELLETLDLTLAAPQTALTLATVADAISAEDAFGREDWRVEVKRVEWALSYSSNQDLRKPLTQVVAALGYVGLASLWAGEAATGETTITCMPVPGYNTRLVLQGPRNKAARMALRRIRGSRFHDVNSIGLSKASWSFPVSEWAALHLAVITHYPNHTGLDLAIEGAKNLQAEQDAKRAEEAAAQAATAAHPTPPTPVAAPQKAVPTCSVETVGEMLKVRTPYRPEFITSLKNQVQFKDRKWNSDEKCWEIASADVNTVMGLVVKHFGLGSLVQ